MKGGWLVVLLSLAYVGVTRRAPACTPVKALSPAEVLSPLARTTLGVADALLFQTREANPAVMRAAGAASVPLELLAAFEPLHPSAPPLAFFKPSRPLDAESFYVLETGDEGRVVPFYVVAESLRSGATLTLSVTSRSIPEDELSAASCYSGPLANRPFTRVADVVVTARGSGAFLVSVTTLDSVSGELISDVALRRGQQGSRIELPLPDGVADCLRVQVFDYAGAVVADEGSMCATPEGEERIVPTYLFMPLQAPPGGPESEPGLMAPQPGDEPNAAPVGGEPSTRSEAVSRTSKGCEVSPHGGWSASSAGIFALGWFALARRRALNGVVRSVTLR